MKIYYFIYVSFLFLMSCEKMKSNMDVDINGVILELGTNNQISDASIILQSYSCCGSSRIEAETISDKNGKFYFSKELKKYRDRTYTLYVKKENFYSQQEEGIKLETYIIKNLYLCPPAWLNINLKNVTKEYDGVRVLHEDATEHPEILASADVLKYVIWGEDLDTNLIISQPGNKESQINWTVHKKNDLTAWLQPTIKIYCVGRDTTFFTLEF